MSFNEPENSEISTSQTILLTGATGYVGGRFLPLLENVPVVLRCLARNPDKLRSSVRESTQIAQGDVLDRASLETALERVIQRFSLSKGR